MGDNSNQPPQNPHASMVRADLLEALLQNPGEVSPCKGGVKKDLKDKSELYACHDNPTPENTHWFAKPDQLKAAMNAMNPHDLNNLRSTCKKFSERIEGVTTLDEEGVIGVKVSPEAATFSPGSPS